MRWRVLSIACVVVGLLIVGMGASARAVTIPSTAFRYVHDADGRLVAASDPSGDTATFGWDPVGNLLNVSRHATSSLKIIGLRQAQGAIGDAVTVDGTGFSTTATANAVEVHGAAATVLAASERSLTFTIPSGATTGTVSVTVGSTTATSAQTLTVAASAAPTITSVSPAVAKPGDTVTVTGTNFDSKIINNVARIGGAMADVSSATSTALQVTVPAGTGSGAMSLETREGTGSGPDVFIPPGSNGTSDIGPTARLSAGIGQTMTFSAPYKIGLATLDGRAGQQMTFAVSNNSLAGVGVYLLSPTGTQTLYSQGWGGGNNLLDAVTLPETGTYTLELVPWASSTGSLDVTGYVSDDIQESLEPTTAGATKSVSLTVPGQAARYSVAGQAGHAVSVAWSSSTISTGTFEWRDPSGSVVGGGSISTGSGFLDQFTFPSTGTYTLVVNPYSTNTGSITLRAYDATDVAGGTMSPTTTGDAKTPSTSVPGQRVRYTFSGTQGEQVSMAWAGSSYSVAYVRLYSPSGTEFAGATMGSGSGFRDAVALPATGTYTLVVDPDAQNTGSASLTVYDASDLLTTITPSTGGDAKSLSLSTPGRNARLTFSASSGQHVAFSVSSAPDQGTMLLYDPSGNFVTVGIYYNSGGMLDVTLSSTGTYTLVVDPSGAQSGTTSLIGYLVNDVTGSLSLATTGSSQSISLPSPAQTARYTVSGTAGQQASVTWQSATFSSWQLYWLTPSGGWLGGVWIGPGSGFYDQVTFPTTGTYQLVLDPYGAATGAVDLTAYDATDLATTITPSAGGDAKSLSLSAPGQNAQLTFSGSSGQQVSFVISSAPDQGLMLVRDSSGGYVSQSSYPSGGTTFDVTLPSSGTYTLTVNPYGSSTGTTYLTAYTDEGGARAARTTARKAQPVGVFADDALPPGGTNVVAAPAIQAMAPNSNVRPRITPRVFLRRHSSARHLTTWLRGDVRRAPRAARAPGSVGPFHRERHQPGFSGTSRITTSGLWLPGRSSRRNGAWTSGLPRSQVAYRRLAAAIPTTAITGHALRIDGRPLGGVTIGLEGTRRTTRTDAQGRFLLAGTPGRHTLIVDGRTARDKHARFGTFAILVELKDRQTIDLGYPLWMTQLDPAGDKRIISPARRDEVLTTPRIPGLEVRLPKGTVIRDADGHVVRDLNLTQVPVDRPPFPLPSFLGVPVYFTVQPGRAYLSKGAQIIYPNYNHLAAGQRVDFWNYDAHDRGWYVYGRGTVTKDATQVVPDPSVRVWEFTGAMISSSGAPPSRGPHPSGGPPGRGPGNPNNPGPGGPDGPGGPGNPDGPGGPNGPGGPGDPNKGGGEPVDLATGVFVRTDTDLLLNDVVPFSLDRTYRQGDSNSYSFGVGATAPWDMRLWSIHNYTELELVMPDGGRVHFERISSGYSFADAVYRSTGVAGAYRGATVSYNAGEWDLVRRDGITYIFGDVAGLQAIRDRFGNTTKFIHASGQTGNVLQVVSSSGRWIRLTYDGSNRVTQAVDNGGREVAYTYSSGRLATVTDPEGRVRSFAYDSADEMTSVTNGRSITTLQNTYDANGRVAQQTLANGGRFTFDYALDSSGNVTATTVTDPRGNETKTSFDAGGYPVEEIRGLGSADEQTWTTARQSGTGRLTSTIDPLGRETTYQYNSVGDLTSVTRMAGTSQAKTTTYTYESTYGAMTSVTDPLGHTTTFGRGSHGELTAVTDPLGHVTTQTYRSNGQLSSVTNALGKTSRLAYFAGMAVSSADPLGRITRWFVDPVGRTVAATVPDGQKALVQYDDDDEPTKVTDPDGAQTRMTYDDAGNQTSVTDANGHATTTVYDSSNRPTSQTDALAAAETYTYDYGGDMTQRTDRKGQVTKYTYDALDRLTQVRYGVVGTSADSTVTNTYDDANRLVEIDDSANGTARSTYDDFDRLTEQSGPQGTVSYTYDDAGRRSTMSAAGVDETSYTYDNANRLTAVARGSQTASFAYDDANRMTSKRLPDGVTGAYVYDDAGQLSSITYNNGSTAIGDLDYAYDGQGATIATWGSLARLALPAAMSSATYDAANEQVTRGGTTLTYDADGELTSDGTTSYTWNARNQLTATSATGTSATFAYDPMGRRSSRTLGGTTTSYLYDGDDAVKETTGTSTATMLDALGADQHLARTTTVGTENLITDAVGSTVALADGTGAVATSYTYTPFGKPSASGTSSSNPYKFTGREDDGTGLQFSRARYYSPDAPGFVSRDPLGAAGSGVNLYAYVGGDPLDITDPTGLDWVDDLRDYSWGFASGVTGWQLSNNSNGASTAGAVVGQAVNFGLTLALPEYGVAVALVGIAGSAVSLAQNQDAQSGLGLVAAWHGLPAAMADGGFKSAASGRFLGGLGVAVAVWGVGSSLYSWHHSNC